MTIQHQQLRCGWSRTSLTSVAAINPKLAPGAIPEDLLVSFVPMSAVEAASGRMATAVDRVWSEVRRGYTTFSEGDVLFAKITPCMENGKVAIARGLTNGFGAGSTEFFVLRPSAALDTKFLLHFLLRDGFRGDARAQMRGNAGQLRVPKSFFDTVSIDIPPLAEQRRIVAEIETQFARLDAAEAALERARSNLTRLTDAINRAVVEGRLSDGAMPESWPIKKLPELGELGRGKSKHRPRNDPSLYGGPYPFIQTGEVGQPDGYIRDYRQTYSEFGVAQSKLWPEGTLCITIAANIADTGILTFPACFPDSVVGFVASDGAHVARYVDFFFRANKDELERFAPATAQKNINLAILRDLSIPLPPADEMIDLVDRAERLLEWIASAEATTAVGLRKGQRLRQSILQRAFSGQLVPQDPDDEPASVLLERIAAERASAAPPRRKAAARRTKATPAEVQRDFL